MARIIEARVIQKVATEAEWLNVALPLYQGEIALVRSGDRVVNMKVGNGTSKFSELNYVYNGGFNGSINPSTVTTDLQNGFYFAEVSGTYNNAGGIIVKEGYYTVLEKYSGGWKKSTEVKMPDVEKTSEVNGTSETLVLTQKGANLLENEKASRKEIGFRETQIGAEFISELISSDIDDEELWGKGFLYDLNGSIDASAPEIWRYSKKYYPITEGKYRIKLGIYGNASIVFYDKDYKFVTSLKKTSGGQNTLLDVEFNVPKNVSFCRISHFVTAFTTDMISIKNTSIVYNISDDVFMLTNEFKNNVNDLLQKDYGVNSIPIGFNFISELTNSITTDEELWGKGFYTADGSIEKSDDFFHSKKYYKVKAGSYEYRMFFSGNARMIYYDNNYNIIRAISGPISVSDHTRNIALEADGYIRISFRLTSSSSTSLIYFKNNEEIKPTIISSETIENYMPSASTSIRQVYLDTFRAKKKRPLVTLISDDGMIQNLDWYKNILDEFKVKSTFSIVGEWTKKADNGELPSVMTSAKLRELYLDGHDIASHTWTHTRDWNTTLTLEAIEEEFSRNKVFLETITDTSVNMFISPFGLRSVTVDRLVSKYYDANFISGYAVRNQLPLDNFFINRVSFDCSESNFALLWDSSLKPAIDSAITNNEWVVFAVHPQYLQYRANNPDYLARREELRTLLQYCKDNNVEVVTAKKGYEYYKNHVDIGVKRVDLKYYKLAMDMTEENVNYF